MGRESAINGKTQLYGLIGNPIGHTFSPMIHNTLAELTGENLIYCPLPVEDPSQVGTAVQGAFALGIRGLNVTVPYKRTVMPYLAEIDPVARAIGAVNTLVRTEKGYCGYNTDYIGLWRALEEHGVDFPRKLEDVLEELSAAGKEAGYQNGSAGNPEATTTSGELRAEPGAGGSGTLKEAEIQMDQPSEKVAVGTRVYAAAAGDSSDGENIRLPVRQVVILGAGGAARAAGFMCGLAGIRELTILNRTLEKALALSEDLEKEFPGMEIRTLALKDAGRVSYDRFLAIQCTKAGLYPEINEVPTTSATFYRRIQAAYDCIYNPEETRFLAEVHKRRKPGWSGLDMLLWQGIAAYEYWTGIRISSSQAAQVRENIRSFLKERGRGKNYVLIGFMGSGKTTIGEALARMLSWQQLDSDQMIEREAEKPITQIFKDSGEEGFRRLETQLLKNMVSCPERYFGAEEEGKSRESGSARKPGGAAGGCVISTGGGIVLKEENRELLRQLGTVVLLDVQPATVVARIGRDSSRPLLQGKDRLRRVSTLLARRQTAYRAAADVVVDTDGKSPDEIVAEILRRTSAT